MMRRQCRPTAGFAALLRAQPLDASQRTDMGAAYWICFQALQSGHPSGDAWGTVTSAINMALLLTEQGICADQTGTLKAAQPALMRARARGLKSDKWGLDGEGITAIAAALHVHDAQLAAAKQGQITKALADLRGRLECGHVLRDEVVA